MQRIVTKFSGLLSATSVVFAILVGIVMGLVVTYAVITVLWGRPDLWPLGAG